jgi:hypothetical protein
MPYAFIQDMPSKDMYKKVSEGIGDRVPEGLIVHLAFETQTGTRLVDLWESEDHFDRFRSERLRPAFEKALQEAGMSRESIGTPQEQEVKPIEIFGKGIAKRQF